VRTVYIEKNIESVALGEWKMRMKLEYTESDGEVLRKKTETETETKTQKGREIKKNHTHKKSQGWWSGSSSKSGCLASMRP
jgi:hypothetical protein